ncbi:uncharacterized protein LOC130623703 isoform X1 [Hydractinia symbiolongicarpus]|uniref:uncharacterized protein LOC130623703 isoform X1 n=2 Tax=Hydractinia symbiolongicarpus TaxID=13093 RepID=UPI00254E8DEC|nr:uncharacterized protein LOC130623703 isoform X1 [Hydractinia symbiolongicarpus]
MAFLCPYGIKKKGKYDGKKPDDAYAAESDDARVVAETQEEKTLLEVVQDYYPCSALELPVRAGEIVEIIENEGMWVFVRAENGSDGYIPRRHCRIADKNDVNSDVGYYSDHQKSECDVPQYKRTSEESNARTTSQAPRQIAKNRKHSESSSHNGPTSSSASPASTISSGYMQITASQRKWTDTKGMFTHQNISSYKPDVLPKKQRYSEPHTQESFPICGRKCQQGCTHGLEGASHRREGRGVHAGVHKSSLPSGKRQVDANINHYADELRQTSEHLFADTQLSLMEHNQLRENLQNYWQVAKTTKVQHIKQHREKERSQSAPVNLVYSKCGHPELIVIKDYQQQGETDISIDRGDFAAIINDTKYEQWMYILNEKGEKGFIPTECVIKHQCEVCTNQDGDAEQELPHRLKKSLTISNCGEESLVDSYQGDPTKYIIPNTDNMTRFIVTSNYSGRDLDDLYVCVGDLVFGNMNQQSLDGWLWVYSPRQKCSGYIPNKTVEKAKEISQASV